MTFLINFDSYFSVRCWKPWIPQLLTCLIRPEGPYIASILVKIAKQYPQALYYHLRTTFLDIRTSIQRRDSTTASAATSAVATPTGKREADSKGEDAAKRTRMEDGSVEKNDEQATEQMNGKINQIASK